MTMPCVRASLPHWSVSCWTATASQHRLRPVAPSSTLSRASTTHIGYTHHWVITPRLSSKGDMPPYLLSQTRNCPPKWGNFNMRLVQFLGFGSGWDRCWPAPILWLLLAQQKSIRQENENICGNVAMALNLARLSETPTRLTSKGGSRLP